MTREGGSLFYSQKTNVSAVWSSFGRGGQHSLSHSTRIDDNLALAFVFEDITCAQLLLRGAAGTSLTDIFACISGQRTKLSLASEWRLTITKDLNGGMDFESLLRR